MLSAISVAADTSSSIRLSARPPSRPGAAKASSGGRVAVSAATLEALAAGVPQELMVALEPFADENEARLSIDAEARWSGYSRRRRELARALEATSARLTREYAHLPLCRVRVANAHDLTALLAQPGVAGVSEVRRVYPTLTESLPLVSQPTVAQSGRTGSGSTVAVIDTGTDWTHPAFGSCSAPGSPGCRVVYASDFAPEDGQADANGHGTNVAAIVLGVAAEARIAALDVFDGPTSSEDHIADALDWVVANRDTYGIAAVNLSLGDAEFQEPCGDPVSLSYVQELRRAGVLMIVSSGNSGWYQAVGWPACIPGALSVGAVYDSSMGAVQWSNCNDSSTQADLVTCFSNSASFLGMLAPGAMINAGGLIKGGTSQAAPHVAGAVAVLRSAFPAEPLTSTISRLVRSPVQVRDLGNDQVKPRLDLSSAVAGAGTPCPVTATSAGSTVDGSLASTDCHLMGAQGEFWYGDRFRFAGTAGQTVTVNLGSAQFDTYVELRRPDGILEASNDNASSNGGDSLVSASLPVSGEWEIGVTSAAQFATGAYRLTLSSGASGPLVCTPGTGNLCLAAGRFQVSVAWRTPSGSSGAGTAVPLSGDTGYFWFFDAANVELVVKVLDGRAINGKFWVFYGALSDVEYTLTVTDSQTGATRTYFNPAGRLASNADTTAF